MEFGRRVAFFSFERDVNARRRVGQARDSTSGVRFVVLHRSQTCVGYCCLIASSARDKGQRVRRRSAICMIHSVGVCQDGRSERATQDDCPFNGKAAIGVGRASIIGVNYHSSRKGLRFFRVLYFCVNAGRVCGFTGIGWSFLKSCRLNRILGFISKGVVRRFIEFVAVYVGSSHGDSDTCSKSGVQFGVVLRRDLRCTRVDRSFGGSSA